MSNTMINLTSIACNELQKCLAKHSSSYRIKELIIKNENSFILTIAWETEKEKRETKYTFDQLPTVDLKSTFDWLDIQHFIIPFKPIEHITLNAVINDNSLGGEYGSANS